jgi:hypothetical protein
MEEAIKAWKQNFKETDFKRGSEARALQAQGTRESKSKANELINGAWKSHLATKYGRHQLAIALLRCPSAAVHTLLGDWRAYIVSEEYLMQKKRSKRYRPEELTPMIAEGKQKQQALKVEVQRLRILRRCMARYKREFTAGARREVPAQHKVVYKRFLSGAFDSDFDDLTWKHGFGQLRTQPKIIGAPGFVRGNEKRQRRS